MKLGNWLAERNRTIVAIVLIASLIIGAVNAVVFSSYRDYVILEQGKMLEKQQEEIAELRLANEVLATGACYGLFANVRTDYAWEGTRTQTPEALNQQWMTVCIEFLGKATAARLNPGQ